MPFSVAVLKSFSDDIQRSFNSEILFLRLVLNDKRYCVFLSELIKSAVLLLKSKYSIAAKPLTEDPFPSIKAVFIISVPSISCCILFMSVGHL